MVRRIDEGVKGVEDALNFLIASRDLPNLATTSFTPVRK